MKFRNLGFLFTNVNKLFSFLLLFLSIIRLHQVEPQRSSSVPSLTDRRRWVIVEPLKALGGAWAQIVLNWFCIAQTGGVYGRHLESVYRCYWTNHLLSDKFRFKAKLCFFYILSHQSVSSAWHLEADTL